MNEKLTNAGIIGDGKGWYLTDAEYSAIDSGKEVAALRMAVEIVSDTCSVLGCDYDDDILALADAIMDLYREMQPRKN